MTKKVLILYTSVGLGHKSMAENIGYQLTEAGMQVKLTDIGNVQKGKFESVVVATHQFINRRLPFIWAWLYSWGHYVIYPFRTFIARFNSGATRLLVESYQPDIIISTQTTGSAVVAFLKSSGVYKNLFGIAFSDFHLHPYWLYKQADFYLANIIEQKEEMVSRGVPAEKIFVCGMTLKPKLAVEPDTVRQKVNIRQDEKIVLVGSGSLGYGFNEILISQLLLLENTKVIVMCGKNSGYKTYLEKKFVNTNLLALGFYQPMAELYAIANVFFSEPGGLSTAEALQYGLPMIITHTLPGQEELNLAYLLKKGLVQKVSRDVLLQAKKILLNKMALESNPNLNPIIKPQITVKTAVLRVLEEVSLG